MLRPLGPQVDEQAAGLVEGCGSGSWSELSTQLLAVLKGYRGQAELLCEIQSLRSW